MTELDKNTQFLSRLVVHQNVHSQQSLAERLNEAKAHERTLRRAIGAVVILGMLSLAGICYSFFFAPELHEGAPILLKLFCISGLASLICVVGFVFFWMAARSQRRGLIDECRKSILARMDQPPGSLQVIDEDSDDARARRAA